MIDDANYGTLNLISLYNMSSRSIFMKRLEVKIARNNLQRLENSLGELRR